jgi:hypothetical protein
MKAIDKEESKYKTGELFSELIKIANEYGISTDEFWNMTPRELSNEIWLRQSYKTTKESNMR